jgi:putative SOS response-associated peptidase YedK
MCGRFSLTTAPEAMRALFDYENLPNLAPRYNIAPTQMVAAVRAGGEGAGRELAMLRWGLVPGWAKDLSMAAKMINARAETLAEKPAFRDAFAHRRCLVPADGFYEWRMEEGRKQPFRIGFRDGRTFAFAGLWERWVAPEDMGAVKQGETVESVTIVTTDANEKLRPIHHRMPVILDPGDFSAWLDVAGTPANDVRALLRPHAPDDMAFYRVTTHVNAVRNDDPACFAPLNKPARAAGGGG